MPKLRMLAPRLRTLDHRLVRPDPRKAKKADPHYATPAHREWRRLVLQRSGFRCEATVNGSRCTRTSPPHRLHADHVRELQDDPAKALDVSNGMALCSACHQLKTVAARRERWEREPSGGSQNVGTAAPQ
jgi:5-methylcytosine-specific restriction endonuclease McrA